MAKKARALGRGLEALFGDMEVSVPAESAVKEPAAQTGEEESSVSYIDINDIKPNENQPRKTFDEEKLEELASSIKAHGLIQPIVVRKASSGYEIVAGERRWRAARKAALKQIPALIRDLTDEENMLLSIIENMQREDLDPIEEAEGINQMIKKYGMNQEQVSVSLGKSRPYISNQLRLLKLPEDIQSMVSRKDLSAGHVRALINVSDTDKQIALAKRAAEEGLSVRQVEMLAKGVKSGRKKAVRKRKSADIKKVEEELREVLGAKVNLSDKGKKGRIEIEYYSRDELERLIELLKSLG